MMIVPMENAPSTTPRESAQSLYSKNVELEKKLKKPVHSKIPSDPVKWRQIRQNYEAVLLTDSDFSESHDVEHALWQLHYRCIEEFRVRLRTASLASAGTVQAKGGETYVRRELKTEILSFFKSFLTEATGFYHDLILKVKAKHGLPLDHLSDSVDAEASLPKDDQRSVDKIKGLMSCHRCLIYLGDLSRYTELYGDGDLSDKKYAVASSYYTQAASLCPRSGNPHHQLAVLASYLGDELLIVYRYFRSLAVQSPCSTARDNLIILFEKNRQSYSQLPLEIKSSAVKMVNARAPGRGRGRGRGETRLLPRDNKKEGFNDKEKVVANYKNFCIRFVRLNGILFTRTSLETFEEVSSSVVNDLNALLSSGTGEELNFGSDVNENVLMIVRFITILIFTVHNVKDSEGQSYAEILQRSVLLQNAYVAAFEFVGHIMHKCTQLKDCSSSFLLPGVLIFLEWLACHLDIAAGTELEEKLDAARSFFWKECISFLNKLVEDGNAPVDSTDTYFNDLSTYDEKEPGGCVALPEDFELRGFLPLQAAQHILDFSKKHSHGTYGGDRAKGYRVHRILAAGRALTTVAQVGQEGAYFDRRLNRFAIGAEPQVSEEVIPTDLSNAAKSCNISPIAKDIHTLPISASNGHLLTEIEEEDEVIVFKPAVAERHVDPSSITPFIDGDLLSSELSSNGGLGAGLPLQKTYNFDLRPPLTPDNIIEVPQQFDSAAHVSFPWVPQKSLVHKVADLRAPGNGLQHAIGVSHQMAFPCPPAAGNTISAGQFVNQPKPSEAAISSMFPKLEAITFPPTSSTGLASQLLSLPAVPQKDPVSRPVRHIGPPPGFGPIRPKQPDEARNEMAENDVPLLLDDYSWLDGYGLPSTKGIEQNGGAGLTNLNDGPDNHNWNPMKAFPFPGKQLPSFHVEIANQKQQYPSPEQLKCLHGHQQLQQNVLMNHNQPAPLPDHYTGSSLLSNRFLV